MVWNPRGIYAKTVRHPSYPNLAATKSVMILDYGDSKARFRRHQPRPRLR